MAFTTATVTKIDRGVRQGGQGIYSEMWFVTATMDPASIAAGAEDNGDFAVPGVQLGDQILAWSHTKSLGTSSSFTIAVNAADNVKMVISNQHASSALDILSGTLKFIVGRPAW